MISELEKDVLRKILKKMMTLDEIYKDSSRKWVELRIIIVNVIEGQELLTETQAEAEALLEEREME